MTANDWRIALLTPWRFLRCFLAIPFYFWMPCPLCGHYFGGWEWKHSIHAGLGTDHGVCNRTACAARAQADRKSN